MSDDRVRVTQETVSDNEQDLAEALAWWRRSSAAEKLLVWAAIQRPYNDPTMEIMSRLAQLAFGQIAEREGI